MLLLFLKVVEFVEKPNLEKAKQFIENGSYFWNAGIFLFSIETFWNELEKHSPTLFGQMKGSYENTFQSFHEMPSISIDYALMEKSKEILVCPLDLSWSDVGSWDSLYEILDKDENQNVKMGHVLDVDTKNCLIIGNKRLISTLGIEDLLIVETEDAIFVTKRGESQRVKSLVSELIRIGRKETHLNSKEETIK
jgi:mannose-1-phosphate guanylyltransferase/mannose-6-phosphate isomerase